MSEELWTKVDRYIESMLLPADAVLDHVLASTEQSGIPQINVSPAQGKLLHLFALMMGAKKILEVGTLAGYSTIWLARALPAGGRLITLELLPKHAEVARDNIKRAGLDSRVEVRVGPALETLPQLQAEHAGPFDLVFIDADKPGNPHYFQWALKLSRPGTVIIVDNVVRNGAVIEADSVSPNVLGVRQLNELIKNEKRVTATTIQTVGVKGYDGFAIARVN